MKHRDLRCPPSIRITLSHSRDTFYIYNALLCTASTHFLRAVTTANTLALDTDICTFSIFAQWLYYRELPGVESTVKWQQLTLVKAWNFGAKWKITEFQNAVMRVLHPLLRVRAAELDAVKEAYRNGPADSIVQQLYVADLAAFHDDEALRRLKAEIEAHEVRSEPKFMLDLIEAIGLVACDEGQEQEELRADVELALLSVLSEDDI